MFGIRFPGVSDLSNPVPPNQPLPADTVTSNTLLLRVRDTDDQVAWREFVDRYGPRIFTWCRQFRLQDSDAADVTQIVLTKLVSAMQQFEYEPSRGRFRGWLKTVTSNAVRDLAAEWTRKGRSLGGDQGKELLTSLAETRAVDQLYELVEQGYQSELLQVAETRVRMRVQPNTWQAYHLAAIEQRPVAEVAEIVGMRVSEVYVAKSRVIKHLRAEVQKLREQDGS